MFSPEHSVIHDNDQIIQKVLSQPLHAFPHHTSRQLIEVFADSRLDNASEILYRNYLSAMPVFDIQEKRFIIKHTNTEIIYKKERIPFKSFVIYFCLRDL